MSRAARLPFVSRRRTAYNVIRLRKRSFASLAVAEALLLFAFCRPPTTTEETIVFWATTGAFTTFMLVKAVLSRAERRMIGYYWTFLAAAVFLGGMATFAHGSGSWFGASAALVLLASWIAHSLNSRMTPAWAILLSIVATGILVMAAADDIADHGLRYVMFPIGPVIVMPYLVSNVRMRSGLITVVTCLGLAFGGLVILGSLPGPHQPPAPERAGPEELARSGLAREINDVTRPLLHLLEEDGNRTHLLTGPVSRSTALALLLAVGYLVLRSLRLSHERQRDTIDLRMTGAGGEASEAEKEATARDLSELQSILTAGSVVIGSERGDVGQGQRLAVALLASIPGGQLLQAFDILTFRAPVVAEVRRLPASVATDSDELPADGADDTEGAVDRVSITVHHPLHRRVRLARQIGPLKAPFKLSAIQLSGYAILAHCLGARGMPVWSEADGTGVGIATWAEVRRRRALRFTTGGGDVGEEIAIIEATLREYDPRSLLLMLEGASRHYENQDFQASASLLTRALDDFPQFPETRLRLALSFHRLARGLFEGSKVTAKDMGDIGPAVSSSILLGYVSRQRAFRAFANEDLQSPSAQAVADRDGIDVLREPIRALEARLQDLWRQAAGRSPADQDLLARYCLHISLAFLEQMRAQLVRGRLALRCLFVQSERVFLWPMLVSRYRVRRLNTAARAVEALSLVALEVCSVKGTARASSVLIDRTLGDTYDAVDRDGTGWRSTVYLAEAYSLAYDGLREPDVARSLLRETEDRIMLLHSVAQRRSLKERAMQIDRIDNKAIATIDEALRSRDVEAHATAAPASAV